MKIQPAAEQLVAMVATQTTLTYGHNLAAAVALI